MQFIDERLGLHETIELLSESDIHLTNRRHSAILAGHAGALPVPINTSLSTHMSGFLAELSLERLFASSIESALLTAAGMSDSELRQESEANQMRMAEMATVVRTKSVNFVNQIVDYVEETAA